MIKNKIHNTLSFPGGVNWRCIFSAPVFLLQDLTESLHEILRGTTSEASPTTNTCNHVKILGIDIDATLINRANEKNKLGDIEYKCLDIMEPGVVEYLRDHFIENRQNFENVSDRTLVDGIHGTNDEESESTNKFMGKLNIDHNVEASDTEANITRGHDQEPIDDTEAKLKQNHSQNLNNTEAILKKEPKFNIVFCFSVTMWIHLNHGDRGLYEFLQKIVTLGKYLVLENQPWKCYRNAQRRMVKNSINIGKDVDQRVGKEQQNSEMEKEVKNTAVENKLITEERVAKYDVENTSDIFGKSSDEMVDSTVNKKEETDNKGDENVNKEGSDKKHRRKRNKRTDSDGKDRRREKKEPKEVGFKHYREIKLRSNVDKEIDIFLRDECGARKLYESKENEWGRVITVYEVL